MNTQHLPVRLTTDELLLRSDELAKTIRERDEAERAMKSAQATAKRKIDLLELDITRLAEVVRDRQENRPVEAREIKNWDRLTMDTIRLDTGEIVGSRSMSPSERNASLFPVEMVRPAEPEPEPEPVADPAPDAAEAAPEAPAETPESAIPPVEEPAQAAPVADEAPAAEKPVN